MLATLDTLVCGGHFDGKAPVIDGIQWVLSDLTGWWGDAPASRVAHKDRPSAHGSHRSAAYLGDRNYELKVTATSIRRSAQEMRQAERKLAALCSDPAQLYALTVEDPDTTLCAYVERDGAVVAERRDGLRYSTVFSIPVVASDPFRYTRAWASAGPATAGVDGVGGIVTSGSGITTASPGIATGTAPTLAEVTVVGAGTRENQLVLVLTGPSGGVQIADLSGTSIVGVRGNLLATDVLYVNCSPRVAYDVPGLTDPLPPYGAVLGGANARSAVWVTGGWPKVLPGELHRFRLTGSTGPGTALAAYTRGTWV